MDQLSIIYKIYLEAEDISASRIQSSIAFTKNLLAHSANPYFKNADLDDESDIEELTLRFYIENEIHEASCAFEEAAKSFAFDLAELLETIAAAHSYMDIEGSLIWQYLGEQKTYKFRSESGLDYCDIIEEQQEQ